MSAYAFSAHAAPALAAPSRLCPQPCPAPPACVSRRSGTPACCDRPASASYSHRNAITGPLVPAVASNAVGMPCTPRSKEKPASSSMRHSASALLPSRQFSSAASYTSIAASRQRAACSRHSPETALFASSSVIRNTPFPLIINRARRVMQDKAGAGDFSEKVPGSPAECHLCDGHVPVEPRTISCGVYSILFTNGGCTAALLSLWEMTMSTAD